MKHCISAVLAGFFLTPTATAATPPVHHAARSTCFDNSGRDDVLSGSVTMIPITTAKGTFHCSLRDEDHL